MEVIDMVAELLMNLGTTSALLERLPTNQYIVQGELSFPDRDDDQVDNITSTIATRRTAATASSTADYNGSKSSRATIGEGVRIAQRQLRCMSMVCKRWHILVTQQHPFSEVWQCVHLQGVRHTHAAVMSLTQARPQSRNIITFDATGCVGLTDEALENLCRYEFIQLPSNKSTG
jgi:hypothetical protein